MATNERDGLNRDEERDRQNVGRMPGEKRKKEKAKGNDEGGKRELAKLDNGEGFLEQTPSPSAQMLVEAE